MEIEKAIRQKKFKDPYERALVNLLYTSSRVEYAQTAVFRDYGLSMQQYNILRILKGRFPEPITVNMLIERMIDKSSNASRIVEKLRLKGFAERKVSPDDRRRVDIFITEKGEDILAQATEALYDLHDRARSLSDEEADTLNALLNKMRAREGDENETKTP